MADEEQKTPYSIWAKLGAIILTVAFVGGMPLLGASAVIAFIRAIELIWEFFH
ncbi:MAG: hypothetical protein QQN63_13585 [Nitrosopumilus sp.]